MKSFQGWPGCLLCAAGGGLARRVSAGDPRRMLRCRLGSRSCRLFLFLFLFTFFRATHDPAGTSFFGVSAALADPPVSCAVKVYVADPDPKGLNVRMKPTTRSPALGVLPTKDVDAVMLTINSAERGWLHFKSVEVAGAKEGLKLPKAGWVSGQLVRVDLQSRIVGATPKDSVLPKLKRPGRKPIQLEDGDRVIGVTKCIGTRVFVIVDRPKSASKLKGWLESGEYCGNPLTTCS
ncbi:MAG: hypothetical protein IPK13_03535 [Deltaproteobacteria bacterium]|nr:hypothetical protein [Deltaproteobacteria bacterium]